MPLAFDRTLLVVVVTLLKMPLGVSVPAGHCANREHRQTLALFEVRDQAARDIPVGRSRKEIDGSLAITVRSPHHLL